MSDLRHYIKKRKNSDKVFAKNYESGYADFKVSVILRAMREEAGLTQEALAQKMHTQKSAISRMENKAEDIRLSTLIKVATILGKQVRISIV
jgi:DNA-binding XRE family transcriptional regulator